MNITINRQNNEIQNKYNIDNMCYIINTECDCS